MSVHRCDDRLTNVWDCGGPTRDEIGVRGIAIGEVRHFFDVGAGCKGFGGASEDDGGGGGVGIERCEGGVEFGEERGRKGIQGSRAVESDCEAAGINKRSIVVDRGRGKGVLRPTPGLGESTRMFSYLESMAEE